MMSDRVHSVAPALGRYTQERLFGEVWNRPDLSTRDRSLITIAALIARGQAASLTYYADRALDDGVKPREIAETVTHLAYYSGWENAMAAIAPLSDVFRSRGISQDELPMETSMAPLPLNEESEAVRAKNVNDQFGSVAPRLVAYTTDYLFRDLWFARGTHTARSQPRHGGRAYRVGASRSDHVSLESSDGQRAHSERSSRSDLASRILCGLAQRNVGAAGREGNLREASSARRRTMTIRISSCPNRLLAK
jgi:alkylhydroperoxidase/carboxymuconolactone decarboxylase family protein YurZ